MNVQAKVSDARARAVDASRTSSRRDIDEAIERLQAGARAFAKLTLDERIGLAQAMQRGYLRIAERSVHAACAAKGIPLGTALEGEEWLLGPWMVVRHLRLVREALDAVRRTGNTPIGPVGRTSDGRLSVGVFPGSRVDGMLFAKTRVDVHLQPGIDERRMGAERARFYKAPDHDGRVVMVLGAGNVNAIVSMDAITKLFNEGKVCLVKMNPVNAYLGPFLEEAFVDAIARGFLAVVYGGAEEGAYVVSHPGIDEVHLTGSDATYDAIVWGPAGPERDARKAAGRPMLAKPITAELGNVSPVIVVPGRYSDGELRHQAEHVAGEFLNNNAFNCIAAAVLVTARGWRQREAFLAALESALGRAAPRAAWYPGARERWSRALAGHGDVRRIGGRDDGTVGPALVRGVDPAGEDAFRQEWFSPVLMETQIGSADPEAFLAEAVAFANDRLWGTLAATLIVPGAMAAGAALERAIEGLRYGTVAVNAYPGLSFGFASAPWGAYPGADPADIQSGTGFVHNAAMLEGIEKAVFRHPLTTFPKPAYFPSHRTVLPLARRLAHLEETGAWTRVPGVVAAAVRG